MHIKLDYLKNLSKAVISSVENALISLKSIINFLPESFHLSRHDILLDFLLVSAMSSNTGYFI